jgi:peptide chain release factor 2
MRSIPELEEAIELLSNRLFDARIYLKIEEKEKELKDLESRLADAELWKDSSNAIEISTRYSRLKDEISGFESLKDQVNEAVLALEMFREEKDDSLISDLDNICTSLEKKLDDIETLSLLGSKYDECDAICEIHAGSGGTDAQDWANMLLRMYMRWGENHGFNVYIQDILEGNEAGILSATLIVKGKYAYGYLSKESGVHRLVRLSPFDAAHKRHTSFASVYVIPLIEDEEIDVKIEEADLRIDTFRASGAGGQHVNVTDSAVRVTHIPTGIVVSCQNERSQFQNKEQAIKTLKAKLAEIKRIEKENEIKGLSIKADSISWGNQIRSYVLAPYQLVKDLRNKAETSNVQDVLDGDIDLFIKSELKRLRSSS